MCDRLKCVDYILSIEYGLLQVAQCSSPSVIATNIVMLSGGCFHIKVRQYYF